MKRGENMEQKPAFLHIRISQEQQSAIKKAADAERRSVSNYVLRVVMDDVEAKEKAAAKSQQ